jgi:Flp pilus assembly protein TadG
MNPIRSTPDGGHVEDVKLGTRNRATSRANRPMEDGMASKHGRSRSRRRCGGDEGAALVEFAIVAPFLFLLIFGIIEFGWIFYQDSDVRHGARETARLAAVNYNPDAEADGNNQTSDIIAAGCERMDDGSSATIEISHPDGNELGLRAVVEVTQPVDSLTGFLDPILPNSLSDSVAIRLEQTASWNDGTAAC